MCYLTLDTSCRAYPKRCTQGLCLLLLRFLFQNLVGFVLPPFFQLLPLGTLCHVPFSMFCCICTAAVYLVRCRSPGIDSRRKGPRLQLDGPGSVWPPPQRGRVVDFDGSSGGEELETPLLLPSNPSLQFSAPASFHFDSRDSEVRFLLQRLRVGRGYGGTSTTFTWRVWLQQSIFFSV